MKTFEDVRCAPGQAKYETGIRRVNDLYTRDNELRSPFSRDYTRIIFSQGYRRLRHKTQVFFNTDNDHVCTRAEHVNLVESVSYTIAHELGLNTELTRAMSVGHDLGHAPFGHGGEKILSDLSEAQGLGKFWHERNSLYLIDKIELLEDDQGHCHNLNLTYAVRDGIISHCGEENLIAIHPRDEVIDLAKDFVRSGQYAPYTYEGCVVKMSDKIAYLARDVEDALALGIINHDLVECFLKDLNKDGDIPLAQLNNGSVVNYFIHDVVENSTPDKGIALSETAYKRMRAIMKFNYQNIYLIHRAQLHAQFVELVIHQLFKVLQECGQEAQSDNYRSFDAILAGMEKAYPKLMSHYRTHLRKLALFPNQERDVRCENVVVYDFINDPKALERSVIDYIAGMTDTFLMDVFNELMTF